MTTPRECSKNHEDTIVSLKKDLAVLKQRFDNAVKSRTAYTSKMRNIIGLTEKNRKSLRSELQKLSAKLEIRDKEVASLKLANEFLIKKNKSLTEAALIKENKSLTEAALIKENNISIEATRVDRSDSVYDSIVYCSDSNDNDIAMEMKTSHRIDIPSDDDRSETIDLPQDESEHRFQQEGAAWFDEGNEPYNPNDDSESEESTESQESSLSAKSL